MLEKFEVVLPGGQVRTCAVSRVCDVPQEFWTAIADEVGLPGLPYAVGVGHNWAKCKFGSHEHQFVTDYEITLSRAVELGPNNWDYTQNLIQLSARATVDYSD